MSIPKLSAFPLHFGLIKMKLQENKDTPNFELRDCTHNPQNPARESKDVFAINGNKALAHAEQVKDSEKDITFFDGKGGLASIVPLSQDISALGREGSKISLHDMLVNMPGNAVRPSNIQNDAAEAPSHVSLTAEQQQRVPKQALILAGGLATRFEPVSGLEVTGLPKPAVPVDGQISLITGLAQNLYDHGIRKLFISTHYLPQQIHEALDSMKSQLPGLKIEYLHEQKALGTAGILLQELQDANCRIDKKGSLLIVQGDALTDANFTSLFQQHAIHNPKVTVATKKVDDTKHSLESFGFAKVANGQESGLIEQFIEKPGAEKDPAQRSTAINNLEGSRQANTGIYILSPESFADFERIGQQTLAQKDKKGKYDYGHDFLENMPTGSMRGQRLFGYWGDVGSFKQLLETFQDILANKMGTERRFIAQKHTERQSNGQQQVIFWQDTKEKINGLRSQGQRIDLENNVIVVPNTAR